MKIEISEKFQPLFEILTGKHPEVDTVIITGGRYSLKSYTVSLFANTALAWYDWNILYTRYTNSTIIDSIKPEVVDKVEMLGLDGILTDTVSHIGYGQNRIAFKGIKPGAKAQTAALKSLSGFNCFINDEAEELPDFKTFKKIFYSIRDTDKRNLSVLILNPTIKDHWIFQNFYEPNGLKGGENCIVGNVMYIHSSYLDCTLEKMPPNILRDYNKLKKDKPDEYDNIVLGGWRDRPEGVIYPNWKIGEFDNTLPYGFALDFGFSVDPDALVKVAVDKKRKIIYAKELMYNTGQSTPQLTAILKSNVAPIEIIIADSAEPRLISEIRNRGFNIKPTKKRQGSIIEGIRIVQDYQIIVDKGSINLVRELNNYAWHDKRSESHIDAYNHLLDALRYYLMYVTSSTGTYHVHR